MLEQLQTMFPNLLLLTDEDTMDTEHYKWYVSADNEIIGIPSDDLTKRERALLEIMLTPYKANQPPTTDREKMWMDVLYQREVPKQLMENLSPFHFVYFSLSDETVDPISFREAINGLFPEKTSILWENNHEGVIIQEEPQITEELVSYSEIIEVLTTDFYMNIKLFVGPSLNDIQHAAFFFNWMKKCYRLTIRHNLSVMHYIEAIPYILFYDITDKEQKLIVDSILYKVENDEELLKTILVFLESNSNTTLAAKKMYMHRNSLQYRVDKFIEKTGIDIKQFKGAITVYLTLLMRTN